MAPKGDHLLKVGAEAFGLLEEIFPNRPPQGPQQQRPFAALHGHGRLVSPAEEAVPNHFEAAKKYGGIVFVDPRKRKPAQVRKVYDYEVF